MAACGCLRQQTRGPLGNCKKTPAACSIGGLQSAGWWLGTEWFLQSGGGWYWKGMVTLYIYIYMYVCMYVCRDRARDTEIECEIYSIFVYIYIYIYSIHIHKSTCIT